ncbi:serine protease [Sulfurimonas lithotrophica]|uniref:Serine protease n=1 Tax=Sulfurimonas lithotrophica TaxID=2590022 RepID=A0A5P8NZA9_9BACT|nr:patatin-like phospholipase family protein [Sulfurimonas lithotrophica]QFR48768.1 serine protease [Sulfurimonas lithotrophica]
MKKRVSLVLGSGGARGLAHIGVIRWLEENGYKIDSISGCSMGALIGAFYAVGKLDAYVEWLDDIDTLDMLKLLDFKGDGGLVLGDKLMSKLQDIAGEHNIEDLPINFTAVATDINAEKEIWIKKGSLMDAIRASISLPLFFSPYRYKDKLLVDGGVLNPVPIAPTFNDDTDITIAVNLGAEPSSDVISDDNKEEPKDIKSKIKEYMSKITMPDSVFSENGMHMVANKSFDTMQGSIANMKLAAYPPDIEIKIPRNICGIFDFKLSRKIIDYGYNKCKESFEK